MHGPGPDPFFPDPRYCGGSLSPDLLFSDIQVAPTSRIATHRIAPLPKSPLTPYLPGAVVIVAGGAIAAVAAGYPLGTLLRPGPGFFPLVIAATLSLMGLGVLVETYHNRSDAPPIEAEVPFGWRAVICTTLGVLVFAFGVERIGYIPSALLLIAISGLAERRGDWLSLVLVALFMSVFGTVVFIWGLGLPIKPFGGA